MTTKLIVLLPLFALASAETYYATPSSNILCPEEGVPCFTLSQYAKKSSDFASNTTLILLPGNHSLDSKLSIHNITNLSIVSSDSETSITCYESARFTFESISVISMRGLALLGCVNNEVTRIDNFTVKDSSFDGQERNGTGLHLVEVSITDIMRSNFSSNTGKKVQCGKTCRAGGAIIASSCTFGISITQCIFQNNTVQGGGLEVAYGGAVFAYSSPNISIVNSTLNNNSVTGDQYGWGGAVCVNFSPNIIIVNSTLNDNSVTKDQDGAGGAVFANSSPNITIVNSILNNNSVTGDQDGWGGAVCVNLSPNIIIVNSTFNYNSATGEQKGEGGAVYANSCLNITIVNSTLNNNSVTGDHQYGWGGALFFNSSLNISIVNSTLDNNSATGDQDGWGGAVFAHLSRNITIVNSILNNNIAAGDQDGWGGAVFANLSPNITMVNSTFNNNSVTGENGQGGAVFSTNTFVAPISIHGCIFSKNIANEGSVFYFAYVAFKSKNFLTIQDNIGATTSGGALIYATHSKFQFLNNTTMSNNQGYLFVHSSNVTFTGYTNIINNSYQSSNASGGGAIRAYQSEIAFMGRVNLMYNRAIRGGGIAATESKLHVYGIVTVSDNTASVSGGGIYAYQSELNFMNRITISRNTAESRGGGIHAIGSTIKLTDVTKSNILGNHAHRGGGLCLEGRAKIYILKSKVECYIIDISVVCISNKSEWILFQLANNTADYGGAVYVADDTTSATCNAVPFNNMRMATIHNDCFIQASYSFSTILDMLLLNNSKALHNRNTYFTNNSATIAGDTLYGGLIDRCEVSPISKSIFGTYYSTINMSYFLDITNLKVNDFNSTKVISSDPVRVCFCKDNQPDCSYHPQPKYVRKGQCFTVSLVAVDHINNSIANSTTGVSTIRAYLSSVKASFDEGQSIQEVNGDGSCTELTYSILSPHNSEELHLYADGPCKDTGISIANLTVNFAPCPVGFSGSRCECDPTIYPEYITNCDIYTETVQRKDNVWFDYVNITNHSGYVLHKYCPFDYCKLQSEIISVNLNNKSGIEQLCAFNRSGRLCGSCEDGSSVILGSSRCRPCSNSWLALIIVFALAGVVLVAFILKVNFVVAEGTFNGLIFYVNIIAANRAIFFPGPHDKTQILSVFIAWLNLDFGLETCFYDGMDAYAKTWLQLAFPIYIISLVIAVILISDHSTKFAMLFVGKNPIATLATLILLSYTKLLRAIIAALQFTTLHFIYFDGSSSSQVVWLVDPNIPYLRGKHIPLFITALIIVAVGIIFTFIIFAWQWLVYCPNRGPYKWIFGNCKVIAFIDAYHNPFNKDHRYWIGLLFLVRVLLYLVSAVNVLGDPSINLLSIGIVATSIFVFQIIITEWKSSKIYKKKRNTLLDCISLLNLIVLTIATFLVNEVKGNQTVVAYISIGIAFITFLVILVHHANHYVFKSLFSKITRTFNFCKPPVVNTLPLDLTLSDSDDESTQVSVTEVNALPEPLDTISTTGSDEETTKNGDQEELHKTVELSLVTDSNACASNLLIQPDDKSPQIATTNKLIDLKSPMLISIDELNHNKPNQREFYQDEIDHDIPAQDEHNRYQDIFYPQDLVYQEKAHHKNIIMSYKKAVSMPPPSHILPSQGTENISIEMSALVPERECSTVPHLHPSQEEDYQLEDEDENIPLLLLDQ